jgi:transcriptional regulator with XRE-family HTH domain
MEFHEKLQELRKQKKLTQEELSEVLFVSRTAISKWESGRGYPSIDSLKAIAEYFGITIDELLSNRELICIAEKDSHKKTQHMRDLVFGLIDCSVGMMFFIPLFGQQEGGIIRQVSLLSLQETPLFTKAAYFAIILLTVACGIATLALQNYSSIIWIKAKTVLSMILTTINVVIFIASIQAYAAFFTFVLLIIKGALLLKRP